MSKTIHEQMVEEFQCPGCVCGSDVECGAFKLREPGEQAWNMCDGHVLGTTLLPGGTIALGLPKGFNKSGWCPSDNRHHSKMEIRLWPSPEAVVDAKLWDKLNVPVWAMKREGYLFVRTLAPRIARNTVDVIKGGTVELVPQAIDVGQFHDEID